MNPQNEYRKGVLFALAAYLMWGIAPIYFKAVHEAAPPVILSHRIIWSFFFLGVLLWFIRPGKEAFQALRKPRVCLVLVLTSVLIGANWLTFIWAIATDRLLEAGLGYFINPLVNVLLGMVFLGEKMRKLQWVACAAAACGVVAELIFFGSVPVTALILAFTFAFYGLLRKKLQIGSIVALFFETAVLIPPALIYLIWFSDSPTADMGNNSLNLNILLISAGIVTSLPLLSFTSAAARLPLSVLGFFQYIGPSLMMVLALVVFDEPFSPAKIVTFSFIWMGLVLFIIDAARQWKKQKKAVVLN